MGLLDILSGNNAAASPWGALFPTAANGPCAQDLATIYAAAGIDPATVQQPSVFGDPSKSSLAGPDVPKPAATGFGAGATPFSFAGPGSNIVSPSQIAAPAAVPLPAPRPAAAEAPPAPAPAAPPPVAAAPAAAPAAADDEDAPTGSAPAPRAPAPAAAPVAPFSLAGNPGLGDRLQAAFQGSQSARGLIPKLFNFGSGLATGQRADLNTPA